MDDFDEIVQEFLVESFELLNSVDNDLLELEGGNEDPEILASIFRAVHTVKGTSGFLGYEKLVAITHSGESLLDCMRQGELEKSVPICNSLFALIDAMRQILLCVEQNGEEGDVDYTDLAATLDRLRTGEAASAETASATDADAGTAPGLIDLSTAAEDIPGFTDLTAEIAEIAEPNTTAKVPGFTDLTAGTAGTEAEEVPGFTDLTAKADAVPPAPSPPASTDKKPKTVMKESKSSVADSSIRVNVDLLDTLMNLVGELVLTRNQILQFTGTQDDPMIATSAHQLNLITTDLQESVMKTRMQPIGNVWSKFPRVVRDLAISCEKKASVVMDGADTELDKTIIEAIKDPLTHLVRNAIDHGLETPETRLAAGKPEEGTLRLYAYHEGGRVNIEISDDGAGIDPAKIKAKAIEKGIMTQAEAARLSDRETFHLLFEPGFSTAKVVSNISGRGVGMDVVKTNIEKIGGSVDILSRLGEGTSVKIKIPLTLAIIPALIVRAGGDRFALPQVNLLELVRLEGEQALKSIEMIDKTPIYRLRGELLPLIYLTKELELAQNTDTEQLAADNLAATNIVVLQADDQSFGLVVDEIIDTEEVVVKPLSKQLKHISSLAGATILGDGKIVLILDVLGLAHRANLLSEAAATRSKTDSTREQKTVDHITLLLLRAGPDRRLAIPLSVVSRLEEVPIDTLEYAGDQEVVQYRGRVMPLIRLTSVLGIYTEEDETKKSIEVVVCQNGDAVVGLVVDEILDVVDEAITLEGENNAGYVLGATVVQNHVTELLNVKAIMETLNVVLFKHSSSVGNTASS